MTVCTFRFYFSLFTFHQKTVVIIPNANRKKIREEKQFGRTRKWRTVTRKVTVRISSEKKNRIFFKKGGNLIVWFWSSRTEKLRANKKWKDNRGILKNPASWVSMTKRKAKQLTKDKVYKPGIHLIHKVLSCSFDRKDRARSRTNHLARQYF